ncbi:tripartite tricarboxylate transporter TctB family protein [Sinorhizobium meliloti]|nr:tripartite tricarboxylate transporter TctB family protein [Sinorhizobium meliloti]
MNIRQYPWPSIIGAAASGLFVLFNLSQRWMVAGEPTAILVPVLVCMTICVASTADALIGILRMSASQSGETGEQEAPAEDHSRLVWYIGSLTAFAVLIEPVGFVASVVLIMPLLLAFGERLPFRRALTIAVCTGGIVYVVFVRLLNVDLPSGWLFYDFW